MKISVSCPKALDDDNAPASKDPHTPAYPGYSYGRFLPWRHLENNVWFSSLLHWVLVAQVKNNHGVILIISLTHGFISLITALSQFFAMSNEKKGSFVFVLWSVSAGQLCLALVHRIREERLRGAIRQELAVMSAGGIRY